MRGIICPPPDGVILRPPSSARVKYLHVWRQDVADVLKMPIQGAINERCHQAQGRNQGVSFVSRNAPPAD